MATVSSMWFVCCSLVLLSALGALSQMSCGSTTTLEDYPIPHIQRRLTEGYDISHLALAAPVVHQVTPKSTELTMFVETYSLKGNVEFSTFEVFITEEGCENWRLAAKSPASVIQPVVITHLKPDTKYKIAVRGTLLDEIYSNFSEIASVKTEPGKIPTLNESQGAKDEPMTPNITVWETGKHYIIAQVDKPNWEDCQLVDMELVMKETGAKDWVVIQKLTDAPRQFVHIERLKSFTSYTVAFRIPSNNTLSKALEVITLPASPSVVENVSHSCPSSEEVLVSWEAPRDPHGVIAVYRVGYYILGRSETWELLFTHDEETRIRVPPGTDHLTFWVTAHTAPDEKGVGGGTSQYTCTHLVKMQECLHSTDPSMTTEEEEDYDYGDEESGYVY